MEFWNKVIADPTWWWEQIVSNPRNPWSITHAIGTGFKAIGIHYPISTPITFPIANPIIPPIIGEPATIPNPIIGPINGEPISIPIGNIPFW